ncbi:MAG: hypothetical protein WCE99_09885 [Nitrososphaeraceae archaeon]
MHNQDVLNLTQKANATWVCQVKSWEHQWRKHEASQNQDNDNNDTDISEVEETEENWFN